MRATILKLLGRFRRDDAGVTLVEYGIALTLAVVVGTAALTVLAGNVTGEMGQASAILAPAGS